MEQPKSKYRLMQEKNAREREMERGQLMQEHRQLIQDRIETTKRGLRERWGFRIGMRADEARADVRDGRRRSAQIMRYQPISIDVFSDGYLWFSSGHREIVSRPVEDLVLTCIDEGIDLSKFF